VPGESAHDEADPAGAPPSVAFAVSRLGYEVSGRLAGALKPLGIEPQHFGLLRALAMSDGQSQRAIGNTLNLHPNRMVVLVDELERKRLVRRRPHPTDRRAHAVVLTPRGRQLLDQALQLAIGIEQELCADLRPGERDQLLRLLARLRSGDPGHPGVHPGLSAAPAGKPGHEKANLLTAAGYDEPPGDGPAEDPPIGAWSMSQLGAGIHYPRSMDEFQACAPVHRPPQRPDSPPRSYWPSINHYKVSSQRGRRAVSGSYP
jgi:DNA-binding MarR family transcriptional regulator